MTPSKRSVSSVGSRSFLTSQGATEEASYERNTYASEATDEQPSPPPGNPPTPPLPPPMRPIEHSALILTGSPSVQTSTVQSSLGAHPSNPLALAQLQQTLQIQNQLQLQMAAAGLLPVYNLQQIGVNSSGSARTVLFKQNQIPSGVAFATQFVYISITSE